MRVQCSVYSGITLDDGTIDGSQLVFSKVIETDWSVEKIERHMGFPYIESVTGYESTFLVGRTLSFLDIYCFRAEDSFFVDQILKIQETTVETQDEDDPHLLLIVEKHLDASDEINYRKNNGIFYHKIERYECGCSGYNEIVCWVLENPDTFLDILVFLTKIVIGSIQWIIRKIRKNTYGNPNLPITLNVQKLYGNFRYNTHCNKKDCQIVHINRLKSGVFFVKIRTISGECYDIRCTSSGEIIEMKTKPSNEIPDY